MTQKQITTQPRMPVMPGHAGYQNNEKSLSFPFAPLDPESPTFQFFYYAIWV